MNKIILALATVAFLGAGTFYGYTVISAAGDLMANSTEVDRIAQEPELYTGENLTAYGYYITGTRPTAPTSYSLVGDDSTIYITECPESDRLGEKVFVKGYLDEIEHKSLASNPGVENGSELDLYENTTSLIFRCKEIIP